MSDEKINSRDGFEFNKINNRPSDEKIFEPQKTETPEKKPVASSTNNPVNDAANSKASSAGNSFTNTSNSSVQQNVHSDGVEYVKPSDLLKGEKMTDPISSLTKNKKGELIVKDLTKPGKIATAADKIKDKATATATHSLRALRNKGIHTLTKESEKEEQALYQGAIRASDKATDIFVKKVNNKIKTKNARKRAERRAGKTLEKGGKIIDRAGNIKGAGGTVGRYTKGDIEKIKGANGKLAKIRGRSEKTVKVAQKTRNAKKRIKNSKRSVRMARKAIRAVARVTKKVVKVIAKVATNPVLLIAIFGFIILIAILNEESSSSDSKKSSQKDWSSDISLMGELGLIDLSDDGSGGSGGHSPYVVATNDQQMIWNVLMGYFKNENIVTGIMCNILHESGYCGDNLENYNNARWGISDADYAKSVNNKTISKKDFCESRYKGETRGYYNDYGQWVNQDGGYGIAQFTSYVKKEQLYEYAEKWAKDKGIAFDISNVEMQVNFLCEAMEGDYSYIRDALLETTTVAEACTVWLKLYEIPYDEYHDDYKTKGKKRAESADEIMAACKYTVFTPRLTELGTELTLKEAQELSDWYGSSSPYGNCGGLDWSVAGHHGNCVSYAWGRRCEIEGERTKLGPWTAYAWYRHAVEDGVYETGGKGSYLKPGAVVCWGVDGDETAHQHVAIIELIERDADGNITRIVTGNSSFTYQRVFYNVTFSSQEELENADYDGPFQGYIFLEKKQQ